MDHGFSTFIMDTIDHNQIDQNEFFDQQKEIEGILSTAFDDITSIRPLSDNEDGDDDNGAFNNIKRQPSELEGLLLNGFNTSTPLNRLNQITDGKSRYRPNFNNIVEEDTIVDVESLENDDLRSNLSSSDHNNLIEDFHLREKNMLSTSSNHNTNDLLDNDIQYKDLCLLKQEFVQISSNYEMLQKKYQKLYQLNEDNVNTIESLKSRIKLLEKQLKNEKNSKEGERRRASMFESKVSSLEYQLNELQKGDCRNRNSEEQMKWFETLKIRHQKELSDLRNDYESKIETLTQKINSKDDELIANCNIILKYKQEASYFQDKVQIIQNEMKSKIQQEIKSAKERTELNLLKSFDDSMKNLKTEWEHKLQEDIEDIVDWFENWQDGQDQDESPAKKLNVRFEKLIDLCNSLKRSTTKREQQIQTQIDRMEDAKRQLEKAILESKMRNSSISSTSSRSDILLEENNNNNNNNNGGFTNQLNIPVSNKNKVLIENNKDLNRLTNGKSMNQEERTKVIVNLRLKYEKELQDIREQFESELEILRMQLTNKEEETSLFKHKTNKYKQYVQSLMEKHKQELTLLKNEFSKVIQDFVDKKPSQTKPNNKRINGHS